MSSNRVTAGIPGLSPDTRRLNDNRSKSKQFEEDSIRDAIAKAEATVEDDGSLPTTSVAAQLGRPMYHTEIIKRLKSLNYKLMFESSKAYPDKMGIYYPCYELDFPTKKFVVGMQAGFVPEFSVRHYKIKEMPHPTDIGQSVKTKEFTHETRGWRTVVLRLVKEGLIQFSRAERVFDIPRGRDSANWQKQVN